MADFNSHTEDLLASSIEKYQELLQHGENLKKMLEDCDYSQVHEYTAKLHRLQEEATRQDQILLPLLKKEQPELTSNTLYQKRLEYISSILELNKAITPKIKDVLAVTSAELNQLRGGRTAVGSYTSPATQTNGHRSTG